MGSSPSPTATSAEFGKRLSRFGARYNAIAGWQDSLFPTRNIVPVSTEELTRLLIREDRRPVMIFAALLKLGKIDGRDFLWFEEATSLESQLKLFIECTSEQARLVEWNPDDFDGYGRDTYAVIAEILAVKPVPESRASFAIGNCLDLMPLSFVDFWNLVYPRWLSVF